MLDNSTILARTLGEHILSLKQLLQPFYRYDYQQYNSFWHVRPWWYSGSTRIPFRFTPSYIASAYAFVCGSTRVAWRRNRSDNVSSMIQCRLGLAASDTRFELVEDNGYVRFPYYSPTFRTTYTLLNYDYWSYIVGEVGWSNPDHPPSFYKSGGDDAICGYFLGPPPFDFLNDVTFVAPAYGPSPSNENTTLADGPARVSLTLP